jgi:hypothetical protein
MRFAAFLTNVALAAFLGGALSAEAKKGGGKGKAPAGGAACKSDNDCTTAPDDCCSCNEGGKQRAIPRKELAAYEKDRRKRCAGTMCTEAMSNDPSCSLRAVCLAGICELGEASSDGAL